MANRGRPEWGRRFELRTRRSEQTRIYRPRPPEHARLPKRLVTDGDLEHARRYGLIKRICERLAEERAEVMEHHVREVEL